MKTSFKNAKIPFVFHFLFIGYFCAAQSAGGEYIGDFSEAKIGRQYTGQFSLDPRILDYSEIEGTPYEFEELIAGKVYFNSGDSAVNYLRYNIYIDKMEFLEGEELKQVSNPNIFTKIVLNDRVYKFMDYYDGSQKTLGYLKLELDGRCTVYRKLNVQFQDKKPAESSYDKGSPALFKRQSDDLYISSNEVPARKVVLSKYVLRDYFGKDGRMLEEYASDNKLKPKKEQDFLEIIRYYNQQLLTE